MLILSRSQLILLNEERSHKKDEIRENANTYKSITLPGFVIIFKFIYMKFLYLFIMDNFLIFIFIFFLFKINHMITRG